MRESAATTVTYLVQFLGIETLSHDVAGAMET